MISKPSIYLELSRNNYLEEILLFLYLSVGCSISIFTFQKEKKKKMLKKIRKHPPFKTRSKSNDPIISEYFESRLIESQKVYVTIVDICNSWWSRSLVFIVDYNY